MDKITALVDELRVPHVAGRFDVCRRAADRLADVASVLEKLVHQIAIGTFFDEHGHDAKMLHAYHQAKELVCSSSNRRYNSGRSIDG